MIFAQQNNMSLSDAPFPEGNSSKKNLRALEQSKINDILKSIFIGG